jgi:16S rRNA (uracil1498-N3)-methyltransferase
MQRYFVRPDQIGTETITIAGDDVHHIKKVMRFRPGDAIICCDGRGTDYVTAIDTIGTHEVVCRVVDRRPSVGEPRVSVTVAQSLPKGDKWEWVLQKGTELGATAFVPFVSARTIVKWDAKKAEKRRERWMRIVKEAAEQAHRGTIPEVMPVADWQALLDRTASAGCAMIAYEGGGHPIQQVLEKGGHSSFLLIVGPEGGFEEREVREAEAAGAVPVSLGSRILRTETAAVAILTAVMYASGEMGGEQA